MSSERAAFFGESSQAPFPSLCMTRSTAQLHHSQALQLMEIHMKLVFTSPFLVSTQSLPDYHLVWAIKVDFQLTMTADVPRYSDGLYYLAALPFNAHATRPWRTASYNLTVARHHEHRSFVCNIMPSKLCCRQLPYRPLQPSKFQLSLPKLKHRRIYPWRRRIDVLSRTLSGAGRRDSIRRIRHLSEHSWRASKYPLDLDRELAVCSHWRT